MALLSLIFNDKQVKIGTLAVDAVVEQVFTHEAEISDNPVEVQNPETPNVITDNINIKPTKIMLKGVHSDTPLDILGVGPLGAIRTITGLFASQTRSQDAYETLLKLRRERKPFTVVTGFKVFDRMVVENLVVTRNARSGASLRFDVQLREIITATSALVKVTQDAVNQAAAAKSNLGRQAATTPNETSASNGSLLLQLGQGVGVFQ